MMIIFIEFQAVLRIGETMTVSDLVFKLINDFLNDVISPWKLSIPKVCPNEVHF